MAPVLINAQSGLAEDLPHDVAMQSAQAGSHHVPLVDPNGDLAPAPFDQASDLLNQGYTQPSPDQLQLLMKHAKYSSTPEQLKTFLEGAGKGSTFGLSTAAERLAGVNPEDIRSREEINPGVSSLGEVAGLGASSLIPGVGEANLLTRAGETAARKLGLEAAGAGIMHKLGSSAVKGAVETAIMSGGNEASKVAAGDPDQSVQSAIMDVGLGGFLGAGIGGALGSVSPLWKAANDSKLSKVLSAIKEKAGGAETDAGRSAIANLAENAGIELKPEMSAALSNPEGADLFQHVVEGETKAGKALRDTHTEFLKNSQDALLNAVGKTPEQVEALAGRSEDQIGQNLKDTLGKELSEKYGPIEKNYENITKKYSNAPLEIADKNRISEQLGIIAQKYAETPDSPEAQIINKMIERIQPLKTLEGFRTYQSTNLSEMADKSLWDLHKNIRGPLRELEDSIIDRGLSKESPELAGLHQQTRGQYKDFRNLLDDLNESLHVGKYGGPKDFLFKLKDMQNERAMGRLLNPDNANLLKTLSEHAPQTADLVRNEHLNDLLATAARKSKGDQFLNDKVLFNKLFANQGAWSPELKKFALPEGSEEKLKAIQSVLGAVPDRIFPSGTPRGIDYLMSKLPAGAMSMISLLSGHNPLQGLLLGQLGRIVTREVPDAVKLATLRFLGSGKPISSEAFKTAVEMLAASMKGQHLMNAAVGNLFKAGTKVLPLSLLPTPKHTEKLDQRLKDLQQNPDPLMDIGGTIPHYLPDHGVAMGAVASRATNYLNSLRPNTAKANPLDAEPVPSKTEQSNYDRALQIAEQPLMVMHHLQKGTLVPKDIQVLQNLYPNLYTGLSQKLTEQVINLQSKGKSVPYVMRTGLSMFLAQPLDSTMTPQALQSIQATSGHAQAQQPQAQPGGGGHKGSMKALAKVPSNYMTPEQAREQHNANKA